MYFLVAYEWIKIMWMKNKKNFITIFLDEQMRENKLNKKLNYYKH